MFLAIAFALLVQAPAAQATPAPTQAEQTATPQVDRSSRRNRSGDGQVCTERAPTGSVMRRTMCRTQRRADADRLIAREYVGQLTDGRVTQEMPLTFTP